MKTYFFRIKFLSKDGEVETVYVPILAKYRRSAFLNLIRQIGFLVDRLISIYLESCDE